MPEGTGGRMLGHRVRELLRFYLERISTECHVTLVTETPSPAPLCRQSLSSSGSGQVDRDGGHEADVLATGPPT